MVVNKRANQVSGSGNMDDPQHSILLTFFNVKPTPALCTAYLHTLYIETRVKIGMSVNSW